MSETTHEREVRLVRAEEFEAWRRAVPDARLHRDIGQVSSPLGLITPIFCVNCGRSCGGVYGVVPTTMVLCDPCRERWGGLPGFEETIFTPDTPPEG